MRHRLLPILAFLLVTHPAPAADAGATLYRRYCASCHGLRGGGDGPAAEALTPRPTDLTRLTADLRVLMEQIDGRRAIRAHGTSAMPVWGVVFEKSLLGEPHARRTALLQLHEIAAHVQALRSRTPSSSPSP